MELKKYRLGDCLELQRGYDLTSSQMQNGEVSYSLKKSACGLTNFIE